MTIPAPTTLKASERDQTTYIVLEQSRLNDREAWAVLANVIAANAQAAIKQALENSAQPGTYLAIPERSWKPVTVKTETKTVLTLTNGETN